MKKIALIIFFLISGHILCQDKNQFIKIDFTSKCCGTPPENNMIYFLEDFKNKNNISKIYGWQICCLGEEGEYALILDLRNFSDKNKQQFKIQMKDLIEEYNKIYKTTNLGSIIVTYLQTINQAFYSGKTIQF